jgi:hypothetical protein
MALVAVVFSFFVASEQHPAPRGIWLIATEAQMQFLIAFGSPFFLRLSHNSRTRLRFVQQVPVQGEKR